MSIDVLQEKIRVLKNPTMVGLDPTPEVVPGYLLEEARRELDRVRDVLLEDLPPLCVSLVQRRDHSSAYIDLLRSGLQPVLPGAAGGPAGCSACGEGAERLL